MNRFEMSFGPVSPANTTPESTCKQGQGQEGGGPQETSAMLGDEAGGARRGSGAREPSSTFCSAPPPRVSHFGRLCHLFSGV